MFSNNLLHNSVVLNRLWASAVITETCIKTHCTLRLDIFLKNLFLMNCEIFFWKDIELPHINNFKVGEFMLISHVRYIFSYTKGILLVNMAALPLIIRMESRVKIFFSACSSSSPLCLAFAATSLLISLSPAMCQPPSVSEGGTWCPPSGRLQRSQTSSFHTCGPGQSQLWWLLQHYTIGKIH